MGKALMLSKPSWTSGRAKLARNGSDIESRWVLREKRCEAPSVLFAACDNACGDVYGPRLPNHENRGLGPSGLLPPKASTHATDDHHQLSLGGKNSAINSW